MNVLAFATHSIHRLGLRCSFQQLMILHKPKSLDAKATSRQFMKCVSFLVSDSNDPITNCDDEWDTNNYGKDSGSKFIDWATLKVKAGNGGDGKAHLKRGRGFLGPDGGDGGKGGDIIIVADQSVKQLKGIKRHYRAQDGGNGQVDYCKGKKGNDFIIKVPVGTVVKNQNTKEIIADLKSTGTTCLVARGGFGGLGNANFKSSTEQRTLMSTTGDKGEELSVELAMKVIADVGLVGFPNAGKSTLLRALSKAKPAVASYPFTTLRPNIGVINYKDMVQIAVADVPGLIKDAHLNKGIGHLFLRHIERCSSLLYIIDVSEDSFVDTYLTLKDELAKYKPELLDLPALIVANKIDIVENYVHRMTLLESQTDIPVIGISGRNLVNIEKLKSLIRKLVSSMKSL